MLRGLIEYLYPTPMETTDPSISDPSLVRQRQHSRKAFSLIADALNRDEASAHGDKSSSMDLYRLGITELQAGIAVQCPSKGEHGRQAQKLRNKMQTNLTVARDRLKFLESIDWLECRPVENGSDSPTVVDSGGGRQPCSSTPATRRPSIPAASSSCWAGAARTASTLPRSRPGRTAAGGSTQPASTPSNRYNRQHTARTPLNATAPVRRSTTVPSIKPNLPSAPSIKPNHPAAAANTGGARRKSSNQSGTSAATRRLPASALRSLDSRLSHIILDDVLEPAAGSCSGSLQQVAGNQPAKRALHELVLLPALRPELFTGLRTPARGLLLFGPPGNGKTMLARALAGESSATFFNISASSLTSKWHGEGEKLVRTLFAIARHLQPSIVFMDEVDALLCRRGDNEQEASRRLKTEFLCQFDGLASTVDDRILVLAATNRPQDLDQAVLRRFTKRIYIPLPDRNTRLCLLRQLLAQQLQPMEDRQLQRLADITDGYTASDITALARDAALAPIREMDGDEVRSVDPRNLRTITVQDFQGSLQRIRKSVDAKSLIQYREFQQEYGELNT